MKGYSWGFKFTHQPSQFKHFSTERLVSLVSPLTVVTLSRFGFRAMFGMKQFPLCTSYPTPVSLLSLTVDSRANDRIKMS